MKTLVLGASGFIGSWTVRALRSLDVQTALLVREGSDLWRLSGVEELEIHSVSEDGWGPAISSLKPDVIVSLDWAGVAGSRRDDQAQWRNLDRQKVILNAAREAGTRRFIGVGSQAEYGPQTQVISTSTPTSPVTEYGKAKLAAMAHSEEFCATHGMEWAWARVFSVFGPLDNGHWLLPLIADALLAGNDIGLTAGEQQWSYLYASDAGSALAALATHEGVAGIYNVGHPTAPRLRDSVEQFVTHFPGEGRPLFGARPYGENAVMRLEPDTSRLTELGWSPSVPLVQGLASTARWLQGEDLQDPFLPGSTLPRRLLPDGR